jgi:hypothetical protein
MKTALLGLTALTTILAASTASAVTRDEAVARARSYAIHQWSSGPTNQTASCSTA